MCVFILLSLYMYSPPLQHQYISQCMTEIKKELKQENLSVKAIAVSKLTYVSCKPRPHVLYDHTHHCIMF